MRVVDLFCGVGGMSRGLSRAGLNIIQAYDNEANALNVYARNLRQLRLGRLTRSHSTSADLADLMGLVPEIAHLSPDIIVGGPPCQDFSSAGKRVEGARARLTVGFAIIICAARPQWFLMENVPRALKSAAYREARHLLRKAGYGLSEQVLDFSRYGVPTIRRRLIVVGRLGEADDFLSGAIAEAADPQPMTLRECIGDEVGLAPSEVESHKPAMEGAATDLEPRYYFIRPYSGGRGVRSIDEPVPSILRSAGDGPGKAYRAHALDALPARSVPTLTFEERSRVQGFPAKWDWQDVTVERPRNILVANAVPPPVAERLGRVILARHRGETSPETDPKFITVMKRKHKLGGQGVRNLRHCLLRARKLLKGRMLSDIEHELLLLESAPDFARLSASVKSDLRRALRKHAAWRKEEAGKPMARRWAQIAKEQKKWMVDGEIPPWEEIDGPDPDEFWGLGSVSPT